MTEKTKFKLLAAFREMDEKIDMSTLENRIIFQKKVYLLQEFGLKLGNSFGWYIRGPYSSTAASDGFQIEKIQGKVENLPDIPDDESKSIEKLKALISDSKKSIKGKRDDYILELLASIHFVLKHGYPRRNKKEEAIEFFLKKKPKFKKDLEVAIEILETHELLFN